MSDAEQGRLAALLAGDWLCAIDDGLCYRHVRCTLCGGMADGYYDLATLPNGHGVAYRLCAHCHKLDADRARVGQLLERRYGPQ